MLTPEDFKTQPEPVVQEPAVEAEAAAPVQPPVEEAPAEQPVAAGPTPEEVALGVKDEQGQYQPTDNTAEKQTRDSGLITSITEGIGYALTGGLTQDVLDKGADAINFVTGGNAQGLADFVMSNDEMEARKVADAKEAAEKRAAGEMGGVEAALDTTLNAVTGISSGTEAGLALPATIAARLANQATPWADPPEQIKQSPVGSTVFEVAQVVVPTLLSGGIAGAFGKGALATSGFGLAGESLIETATQDSAEDLIAGRSLAGKYGELADYLGFDGSQLTQDLIEGTTPQAQTINALTGFVQNFGINVGANSLVNQVGKKLRPGAKAVDPKPPATNSYQTYVDEVRRAESAGGDAAVGAISPEDQARLTDLRSQVNLGDEIGYKLNRGDETTTSFRSLELPNGAEVAIDFTGEKLPDGSSIITTSWDVLDDADIGPHGRRVFSEYQRLFRELEPGTVVQNTPAPDGFGGTRSGAQVRQTKGRSDEFFAIGKQKYLEVFGEDGVKAWDEMGPAQQRSWMNPLIESGELEIPSGASMNVRARLYERAGFGKEQGDGFQYAVIRSAPDHKGRMIDPFYSSYLPDSPEFAEELARAQAQAKSYQPFSLPEGYTPDAQTKRTSEILGKSPEEIEEALADVTNPAYSPDREITDAMDVDSQVPVSRPTGDNEVISEAALIRETTRTVSGVDGLTTSQRNYFTNINNVMRGGRKKQLLQEVASGLRNLRGQDAELQEIAARSAKWLSDNGELSMDEMREALKDLAIKPLDTSPEGLVKFQNSDTTAILREIGAASDEGMMILPILLEEATVRLQKAATIAANVDELMDVPFDATKAFEDFLQLQDFVEDLSIPLRRAKRQWSTSGKAQQRTYRRFMEKMIDDVDVSDVKASSASDKFVGYGETQTPMRQLYEAWKGGDEAAGQTFKEYLSILKGMPTELMGAGVKNMDTVLRKALNQGNTDAVKQLFFAFMLSRPGTQLAAFGGGTLEAIIQPLGKMAQGVPLISSPGGAITNPKARATFFQGVGEFYGGMKSINDGLSEWRKAFQSGKSLTSSSKIDSGIQDVVKKRLELKNTYEALQEQLTRDGAGEMQKFNLAMVYQLNNTALHPVTQVPMRSLTATDSGLGLVIGNQKAYGRAFANWSQNGGKLDELIPQEMDKIWSDGVKYGSFKDTEVAMGVRELMLQNDIPTNGNFVDSAFAALDTASKDSAFFRIFNPFVRLSYQSLETAARYSLLSIPGVTEALPKYKKILAGEMGQVAQQQLESQIAFGRLSSMSIAGIAYQGGSTGHNPPNGLPPTSFIIPAPWTEKGYLAVPYGKLQPFATHIALISDATTGLRDKVINQGEYDRYVGEMVMSLGISAFDSNFLIGMQNMVEVISSKTWSNEDKLATALADAASVLSPRVLALAGNIQNPYKEFLDDKTNPALGFGNKLRNRMLGGMNNGSTTQYNIYDGKKIPRVATLDGANDNYWAAAAGVAFAEVAWTGKVQNAEVSDRQQKMSSVGYEVQRQWYTTAKIDGAQVQLTPVEQSKLSEYLGKQGKLANSVDNYLKSKSFKEDYSKFVDQSQQDNGELPRKPINKAASLLGQTTVNAASEGYQERMKSKLAQIHEEAKAQAAIALFKGDPSFDQRLQTARLSNPNI